MIRSAILAILLLSSAAAAMRLNPLAVSTMVEDRRQHTAITPDDATLRANAPVEWRSPPIVAFASRFDAATGSGK
jgi:hypothetical protein